MRTEGIPDKLSLSDIFVQMIEAVQEMHLAGYIHKDIKTDNFRIMDNRVVLIDFGLAMTYNMNGKHLPRERYGLEGSMFFASIRAHQGYTLSRRDDLESVGYSILYLMNPDISFVPWTKNAKDM
jgi:serine/threonine protein kinase